HLLSQEGRRLAEVVEQHAEGRAARYERDAAVATFRRVHGWFDIPAPALRAVYSTKAVILGVDPKDTPASDVEAAREGTRQLVRRSTPQPRAWAARHKTC